VLIFAQIAKTGLSEYNHDFRKTWRKWDTQRAFVPKFFIS